ncbi:hypothetical protein AB7M35_002104 [Amorphus suaedae]
MEFPPLTTIESAYGLSRNAAEKGTQVVLVPPYQIGPAARIRRDSA